MDLEFDKEGAYRIRVKGYLPEGWTERMGGMAIRYDGDVEPSETVLYGQLRDQAALLGVLNALYGLHLPLLSVKYLAKE
jgi:hypothetical protein